MNRPILTQTWNDLRVTAPATTNAAVALDPNGNQNQLINAFALSIPTGGVDCFLVGQPIAATSGISVIAGGGAIMFRIEDERMLKELVYPAHVISEILGCKAFEKQEVPLVVWDLSQIFIVSSGAAQLVNIATFKMPYV